jgi:RimJ/RimL family protein N-acetyltransferase/catechol 2,3-dioxygenase-like lactoylglutathione lyase family enzyme
VHPPELRTARLRLVPLSPDHADDLHPALSDADALRWWADPPSTSVGETRDYLDRIVGLAGSCWWAVGDVDGGPVFGYAGFLAGCDHPGRRAGFGYILERGRWGQGFATEAARAAVAHGFDHAGVDRVEMWVHRANEPSRRLATRLGATPRAEFLAAYPRVGAHHTVVYGLTREEWAGQGGGARDDSRRVFGADPVVEVNDVAATAHWYRDVLGFEVDFLHGSPPTHGAVRRGDWTAADVYVQLVKRSGRIPRSGWLHVRVGGGIDELFEGFRSAGAQVAAEPANHPWGMREFEILDPNGQRLRFSTPAPAPSS